MLEFDQLKVMFDDFVLHTPWYWQLLAIFVVVSVISLIYLGVRSLFSDNSSQSSIMTKTTEQKAATETPLSASSSMSDLSATQAARSDQREAIFQNDENAHVLVGEERKSHHQRANILMAAGDLAAAENVLQSIALSERKSADGEVSAALQLLRIYAKRGDQLAFERHVGKTLERLDIDQSDFIQSASELRERYFQTPSDIQYTSDSPDVLPSEDESASRADVDLDSDELHRAVADEAAPEVASSSEDQQNTRESTERLSAETESAETESAETDDQSVADDGNQTTHDQSSDAPIDPEKPVTLMAGGLVDVGYLNETRIEFADYLMRTGNMKAAQKLFEKVLASGDEASRHKIEKLLGQMPT